MKAILNLLVLLAVVLVALYYFGGYRAFDPSEQGRQARARIQPGMPWQEAFDVTGDPRTYRTFVVKKKQIGGETVVVVDPGPEMPFTRSALEARLAEDSLPLGFMCTFRFSESVAFTLNFDALGVLEGVENAVTMADLLQMNDR